MIGDLSIDDSLLAEPEEISNGNPIVTYEDQDDVTALNNDEIGDDNPFREKTITFVKQSSIIISQNSLSNHPEAHSRGSTGENFNDEKKANTLLNSGQDPRNSFEIAAKLIKNENKDHLHAKSAELMMVKESNIKVEPRNEPP